MGKKITEATFSSPIRIIGFDRLPRVGEPFFTFATKKEAEDLENKLRKERESNPIYKTEELISNPPIIVKENSRISKLDKKKKEIKQVTNESTEVKE